MKPGQLARKSIATRAAIVAYVADNPRSTQSEVARAVRLTRMTVSLHMNALVAAGLLVREQSGKYSAE